MRKEKRRKGFTLVEVIVVLVILVILLAIAVPAVTRYIKKAKENSALMEARNVVTMAQLLIIDKMEADALEDFNTLDKVKAEILKNANVKGDIIQLNVVTDSKNSAYGEGALTFAKYSTQGGGLTVIYDIDWKKNGRSGLYSIGDGSFSGEMGGYLSKALEVYINPDNGLVKFDKNGNIQTWGVSDTGAAEKLAQALGGKLPKAPDKLGADLYWHPFLYWNDSGQPQVLMFTSKNDSKHQTWNTNYIYVDGQLYKYKDAVDGKDGPTIHTISNYRKNQTSLLEHITGDLGFEPVD